MEKKIAKHFLERSLNALDSSSRLLNLYDGFVALYGSKTLAWLSGQGLDEERMKNAIDFARADSDSYKMVTLSSEELNQLEEMLRAQL